MISNIIQFSLRNKFLILIFTSIIIGAGLYSLSQIPIGAVPDVTNNQVQVITTSKNLSTQDIEQFITAPVELEMANLPGVKEIRSISKFGLSVVTIVFEDKMGTFLPRQLIAEKIKSATEKIPEGFGAPEMGPISTGLGEIYQYILDVKPGFKKQYSVEDLRTIQDWIVKRQLSGIPGVVEVNTWGGFLKQYEVAINTQKLQAMNISVQEVFTALEKNNSVSGGGYIEKVNQAFFIRGEGLISSLKDIENIVVKNTNGIPVYMSHVANVGYGTANRFGAITANGEGEKVLGQVMMLKGANSKEVIEAVKARVAEISKSLPEGVFINPFLDRSELIAKTTFTVTENLLLGCLIVVFVVVLLLGNLRSGLVVASVIPLCLLFALSLMYVFGIDANLMSLGAIDFGIIIDGAVIIVEYIAFQLTQKKDQFTGLDITVAKQQLKDEITFSAANKMMNSAIFGQLIILIVFIPILSLSGVEGKMFIPMALTFSFALIGAMILCFTYVPVAASLFLKPLNNTSNSISERLMKGLYGLYEPIIDWALARKKVVLAAAVSLLLGAILLFSQMGAEFVPTLDEGDFVIQPVLKTGTSLSKTVATTTAIEKILLKNFPEVKQVVTRIGAAEVPTDPMSMEESDVIITLKPKNEWVSASTKDQLADQFKTALSVIPGMEVEFTQPIEMRFNELITGVRADIAIKIFGDDLAVLTKKGAEIGALIQNIEGAADISVEKIAGLPEMNVKYNREKIARYGLNIQDLNQMLSMAFAGKIAGSVFEGEKRFDLVVRLEKAQRTDISNLKNLYVDLPSGGKIPLSELATIQYTKGAAKIARDNTRRRIVVGVNVRNRDLQSVVEDIKKLIQQQINLPIGYSISYGGQFENLQTAKARLLVAVPIALVLIFLLLYFAFKSIKEALLIYSAIPLSAVGGVLFLWFRDQPFSISAGVGFIALFGIAVLNGIVLIEHFKELQKQSFETIEALIKQGTKDRLRAVILTASAAALGFLPMAISTNAGAEVQRPLATVVIGGLISATLLTLVVLPVLYAYMNKEKKSILVSVPTIKGLFIVVGLFTCFQGSAQGAPKNLESLIPLAIENNKSLAITNLSVLQSKSLVNGAFDFDKTAIYYQYDQNNLSFGNLPLNVIGIQQDFKFPTVYFSERKLNKERYKLAKNSFDISEKAIKRDLTQAYFEYQIALKKANTLKTIDSLYKNISTTADRKFELGESNYLEKISTRSNHKQVQIKYRKAVQQQAVAYLKIAQLVQSKDSLVLQEAPVLKALLSVVPTSETPELSFYENKINVVTAEKRLALQQFLPDIGFEYFQGRNSQLNSSLNGYQLGLKIPLFFGGKSAKFKAASMAQQIEAVSLADFNAKLASKLQALSLSYKQLLEALAYYENEGNQLSEEIIKMAQLSFKTGAINYFEYIQSMENAYEIQMGYFDALNAYNQVVININYITL